MLADWRANASSRRDESWVWLVAMQTYERPHTGYLAYPHMPAPLPSTGAVSRRMDSQGAAGELDIQSPRRKTPSPATNTRADKRYTAKAALRALKADGHAISGALSLRKGKYKKQWPGSSNEAVHCRLL